MREILFRGKRLDDGEWAYGFYVTEYGEHYIFYDYGDNKRTAWIPIDPATVGQYIGLTDKNGTKIFEGDILDTTNSNCRIWFVDYKNTSFCCNQGNINYSCPLEEFMLFSDVEVIGNIHDNPELLKGGAVDE